MSSNLFLPVVALVIIVAAAFVVGRFRVGDWDPRRDGLVLGATALMGGVAVLLVLAPPAVALIVAPTALIFGGLYLLTSRAAIEGMPAGRHTWLRATGVGALVMGCLGIIVALVRRSG